ncbi:hypothetical protein B0I35DRAFT_517484 [Stachybotrys elegans]|uniref:Copper amine oxidase catalytic domain-containing protein n=1 Tax=Stachybotrys elegans TaxID=80388 RepID=A0A8K0SB76_9HYPO|nr:hypothetical protein B0I35DRAFT_517484 [Stachybotrys elegans]
MPKSKGKVFYNAGYGPQLTGASGFVGSHIAAQLLSARYAVKVAFRSEAKANFVIHYASPFTFTIPDIQKDLLDPDVKGTTEILKAVEKTPSVKRVVVTLSFATVIDPFNSPRQVQLDSHTISHKGGQIQNDWNPVTHERPWRSKIHGYQASKTFAERIAWDFVESQKKTGSALSLMTICPPMVLGPVHPAAGITAAHPNESSAQLRDQCARRRIPPTRMPCSPTPETSKAHVAALDPKNLPFGTSEFHRLRQVHVDGAREITKGSGKRAIIRARNLVIQSILTVGNYQYIFAWIFWQNGNIELETRAFKLVNESIRE